VNSQQRNVIEEEMHRVFESATRVSAIYALAERGLSATAIASRLARKGLSVSGELVLRTIQENGWSWHPEFSETENDDPVTVRIRKLIAVGYRPCAITEFVGEPEEVVWQMIVSAGMGHVENDVLYIDPKYVNKSARMLYEDDPYVWHADSPY
jgi:hypothetical protein